MLSFLPLNRYQNLLKNKKKALKSEEQLAEAGGHRSTVQNGGGGGEGGGVGGEGGGVGGGEGDEATLVEMVSIGGKKVSVVISKTGTHKSYGL